MELATALNRRELQRYLDRVGDRWPIEAAMLGGARVADERGAPPQRERGPEFVVVLVSHAFEGMPWLERVYQAARCGTASRWARPPTCTATRPTSSSASARRCAAVREAADDGIDLLADRRYSADRDHPLDRHAAPARRSSAGTLTSCTPSRSASRSLGSVIIFMKRQ